MTKFTVIILVIFLLVQVIVCDDEEATTDAETTSPKNFFENIRDGLQSGLNEENVNKFKDGFKNLTDSVATFGNKVGEQIKKIFEGTTTSAPAET